jgi:uncharacterized protein (TIGR01568 family)
VDDAHSSTTAVSCDQIQILSDYDGDQQSPYSAFSSSFSSLSSSSPSSSWQAGEETMMTSKAVPFRLGLLLCNDITPQIDHCHGRSCCITGNIALHGRSTGGCMKSDDHHALARATATGHCISGGNGYVRRGLSASTAAATASAAAGGVRAGEGPAAAMAMVKSSYNPHRDFKESMLEMVMAQGLGGRCQLQQLLHYYLSLNSDDFHPTIVNVFNELCCELCYY